MDDHVCAPEDGRQSVVATIAHPESGSQVGANVALWGTSTPGGQVQILDGTEPLTSADVDDLGVWGASLRGLSPGTHDLCARDVHGSGEDGQVSMPVQVVVGGAPPARTSRRVWPLLVAGIVIAGGIAAAAAARGDIHLRSSPSSQQAGIATRAPARATAVAAPAPARAWSFPALTGSVDQAILALNNPGAGRAVVSVAVSGSRQRVSLQPQGEAEMELGARARAGSIGITSTAPIIAERIVVKNGKTTTSYGSHR